MSGQVSTISRAVVILGVSAVRNLALGLSIAGIMGKGRQSSLWSRFWDHSLAAATAAEHLARETGYPDPEEAFVAGLLHDVGHLVFMLAAPGDFCDLVAASPGDFLDREEEMLGMTHTRCGQKLLKHWKLPRPLEQTVRFHHTGSVMAGGDDPLVTLVGMADLLAGCLCGGLDGSPDLADFLALLKLTGLEVAQLGDTLTAIRTRLNDTRAFLQIALDTEELPPLAAGSDDREFLEVAVVGNNPQRSTWTMQVLSYWGHQTLPMKSFFAQAAQGDWPDLVILDVASLTQEQLAMMTSLLVEARGFLALLGNEERARAEAQLGEGLRHLPLGFCQNDLNALFSAD